MALIAVGSSLVGVVLGLSKIFRTHENKLTDPLSQFHLTNRVVLQTANS